MNSNPSANEYNGFSFAQDSTSRMFQTKVNDKTYSFYNWPGYLEDVSIDPAVAPLLSQAQVVIYTFDPVAPNLPMIEQVRYDFSTIIPAQTVFAVTKNDTTYAALPLLTCKDAEPATPVIFLNVSDNTSIVLQGSCIIVNANGTEFIRARDRLLYTYLGVMKS